MASRGQRGFFQLLTVQDFAHNRFLEHILYHDLQGKKDVALEAMASGESGDHECRIQKKILRDVQDVSL